MKRKKILKIIDKEIMNAEKNGCPLIGSTAEKEYYKCGAVNALIDLREQIRKKKTKGIVYGGYVPITDSSNLGEK